MPSSRPASPKKTSVRKTVVQTETENVDVYASFVVRSSRTKAPAWHPIKKMRYVFWRMMSGITISDACRELRWEQRAFWRELQIERPGASPFKDEYVTAKTIQSRAMADSVLIIAEGRDRITRRSITRTNRIIERSLKRMQRTRNSLDHKKLLQNLLADLREHDKVVITRNKLQMDASKWLAAKMNPNEFADKSSLGLSGLPYPDEGGRPSAFVISFVGPDGNDVPFAVEASTDE